ncbi:2586_t:CDS:1, partial [Cetraspora pellucida]
CGNECENASSQKVFPIGEQKVDDPTQEDIYMYIDSDMRDISGSTFEVM